MPALPISTLPIEEVIDQIKTALRSNHELVLEAPPGAGKTTLVPLALRHEKWLADKKIVMLEPRRIAARAAAERMAELLGEKVGETVGYRVRMDTNIGPNTRIEVVTEGILNRMLQDDPALDEVGLLIFDEFHERSLDADLGLALTLQGRELFGDVREHPLKLLVMSATLDGLSISTLLNQAPIISSKGRSYPVEIIYSKASDKSAYNNDNEKVTDRVANTVLQALEAEPGSLLVFLPGLREINEVQQLIAEPLSNKKDIVITPLYGNLALSEQRKAIQPAPAGKRKVVLTTAIAETSLTIEGVRVVIDSGLARLPEYDPKTAMTRLKTERVSRAAAKQRAGRAGRTESGICYRLWAEDQHHSLAHYTAPEIEQADLTPLALQLINWGVSDPAELSWLKPPAEAPFQQAKNLLIQLGALTSSGCSLTAHGKAMAQLPLHPRLSHMLVTSRSLGQTQLACQLAALLSERDPLQCHSTDLLSRLELIRGERVTAQTNSALVKRIQQLARQFERAVNHNKPVISTDQLNTIDSASALGLLTALAYPDRIALRQSDTSYDYKLSNGRQAAVSKEDPLQRHQTIAIAQMGGQIKSSKDRIYLATQVDLNLLQRITPELYQQRTQVDWNQQTNRLIAEKQTLIGKLVIERKPLSDIPQAQRRQALAQLLQKKGLSLLPWTPELRSWCARIELLRHHFTQDTSETLWPDMSERGLLADLENWLLPFIDEVSHIDHFKKLDLKNMLASRLAWPLPQRLDELAPERMLVPSGSRIAIDYTQSPPVLAVKLQEMFGQKETPAIANGRVKLVIHLLSPARRPLQVTQDLAGFWQSSYQHVKKEMKGRYPKHPWPDDPTQAEATARAKPRNSK